MKACPSCWIPKVWFNQIEMAQPGNEYWTWRETRREAEDAAALAFSKIPAERRAELLTGATGVKPNKKPTKRKGK